MTTVLSGFELIGHADTHRTPCLLVGPGFSVEGEVDVPGGMRLKDLLSRRDGTAVAVGNARTTASRGIAGTVFVRPEELHLVVDGGAHHGSAVERIAKTPTPMTLRLRNGWTVEGKGFLASGQELAGVLVAGAERYLCVAEATVLDENDRPVRHGATVLVNRSTIALLGAAARR